MTACDYEGCSAEADQGMTIYGDLLPGQDEPMVLLRENVCYPHFLERLCQHPDKDVPWPIYGPAANVPFHYIRCDQALKALETETPASDYEPWFAPKGRPR